MEGDTRLPGIQRRLSYFNPLPPGGGRPFARTLCIYGSYFNPLPPGGGRPAAVRGLLKSPRISIHSLRVEGDRYDFSGRFCNFSISIHSLRVEGDTDLPSSSTSCIPFQSTPSGWRETPAVQTIFPYISDFNPLPPGGGRLYIETDTGLSITNFNPLPPGGGRRCPQGRPRCF